MAQFLLRIRGLAMKVKIGLKKLSLKKSIKARTTGRLKR